MLNYLITDSEGNVITDSSGEPVYSIYYTHLCAMYDGHIFNTCVYDDLEAQPATVDYSQTFQGLLQLDNISVMDVQAAVNTNSLESMILLEL